MQILLFALLLRGAWAAPVVVKFGAEPFPPFSYAENGKPAGPMVEMVMAVCAAAEMTCTIEVMPWRRILKLAEIGELDGVCMALRIPEREQQFFITDDVVQSSFTFFTQASSQFKYRKPEDLNNTSIGVYGPSGTSATLADLTADTNATTTLETDNLTALRKLAAGRYGPDGAILINRDVAMSLMKENNLTGLVPAGDAKVIRYALGLTRLSVSPQQAELFGNKLRALKRAGTLKTILQKYGITPAP
jgi:polar amino acid transport system substrate-binding protein